MKDLVSIGLVVLLGVSACSTAVAPDGGARGAASDAEDRYQSLVVTAQEAPTEDTLRQLREAFVESERYKPYESQEADDAEELFVEIADEDWSGCLEVAERMLDRNYSSLYGHFGVMSCARHKEKMRRTQFHETVLSALLGAIWASGDGTSMDRAFVTISTPELQAFLQLQRLETVGQSMQEENGRWYEVVTVRSVEADQDFKLYFDITRQWSFLKNPEDPS